MSGYFGRRPAPVVAPAARTKQIHTATAGQTVFTGTFVDSFVEVYRNGVRQVLGTDFTLSGNTAIVLTEGALADDQVVVLGQGGYSVVNTVPTQGGTFEGPVGFNDPVTINDGMSVSSLNPVNGSLPVAANATSGDAIDIYNNGGVVGRVRVSSNDNLEIGATTNGGSGLMFWGGGGTQPYITPMKEGSGDSDGEVDFGRDGQSFRNMHLSGGLFLGGTGSAHYLDDYEEGTWTPTYFSNSGYTDATGITVSNANYVKIGNIVHITAQFTVTGTSSTNVSLGHQLTIRNLPFSPKDITAGGNVHPQGRLFIYQSLGSNIWADGMCLVDNSASGLHLEVVTVTGGIDHNDTHMINATYQV